eukprot:CAMPEP_0170516876 /NCGR_PEP_ID=MMETSP0209-20121228/3005_1 /TAXON_ID=665100 ORGANISM="Litonotus pictus, Strain P1" /NCGR_SAMPLE_ID=MMETSP0209 /ASSEMBLY_ACC=CAM_ASM_000301 /LENGTH=210 /DNA_ID=CAMNT_0010801949 /DNA_START=7 /DNA_END=639 /DNA_ORIENTATION=+
MNLSKISKYEGDYLANWYHGKGKYTFDNGVIYEGEFYKGEFHGEGIMSYPNGGKYKGTWKNGILQNGDYIFKDGLNYKEPARWDYCTHKDRRFYYEIVNNIKNPEVSNYSELNKEIPESCYDTGDGYYDPEKGMIFSYDQKFLRYPNEDEEEWIKLKCRYNPSKIDPSNYNNEMFGYNDEVIKNVMREYKFKNYKMAQGNLNTIKEKNDY